MRRKVETWTVEELYKLRARISFPEYQRQPNLWTDDKKSLLIDSILSDIDVPKLYFYKTPDGGYEVVDGQQRLWAIWDFLDGQYGYETSLSSRTFKELSQADQKAVQRYPLQVTVLEDASDEYLRKLFVRLQLGLLLVPGEKLNAAVGAMKEWVFKKLVKHEFVVNLGIPERRFSKETLCAQLAVNSFSRKKLNSFARTRYEDLVFFFQEYEQPKGDSLILFRERTRAVAGVLDNLSKCFGERTRDLRNRSYVVSVYLLFEERQNQLRSDEAKEKFARFVFALWKRLKEEKSAGFDRKNRELYVFETMLSSAPGEKYQIERRHLTLLEYYEHYLKTGKVKGDKG